jgi:hypothetical protein
MFDLEQLRSEWMARDAKLEGAIRLNAWFARDAWLEKQRAQVLRHAPWNRFERASFVLTAALLGWFLARNYHDMKFFLPAFLLMAWTIVMAIAGIRQRRAMRDLDLGKPLVVLQKEFATLRLERLQTLKWAFLTGQIVWWVPFVIVLFKGALGVNLYALSDFMPRFMAWNIVAGILFIPLALWLTGRYGAILQRAKLGERFTDLLAGADIAAARAFLDRLARFESETTQV